MRKRFDNLGRQGLLFAVVVILGSIGLLVFSGGKMVFKLTKAPYMRVIERLQDGRLKAGKVGDFDLPADVANASFGGTVFMARTGSNELAVVFKTWVGKGRNLEGYLYVARPLTNGEVERDVYGNQVFPGDEIDLVLEEQLGANWYRVSYRLD